MTVEEVAAALYVSERTVRTYIANKELKAVKLGKMWRINKADLQSFLESRSNMKGDQQHE